MKLEQHRSTKGKITPSEITLQQWQGTTPDIDYMERIEALVPGSAKQFIEAAMSGKNHKESTQSIIIKASIYYQKMGIWFAFLYALALCGVGTLCILRDCPAFGTTIICTGIAPVIAVFILRQFDKQQPAPPQQNTKQ